MSHSVLHTCQTFQFCLKKKKKFKCVFILKATHYKYKIDLFSSPSYAVGIIQVLTDKWRPSANNLRPSHAPASDQTQIIFCRYSIIESLYSLYSQSRDHSSMLSQCIPYNSIIPLTDMTSSLETAMHNFYLSIEFDLFDKTQAFLKMLMVRLNIVYILHSIGNAS